MSSAAPRFLPDMQTLKSLCASEFDSVMFGLYVYLPRFRCALVLTAATYHIALVFSFFPLPTCTSFKFNLQKEALPG